MKKVIFVTLMALLLLTGLPAGPALAQDKTSTRPDGDQPLCLPDAEMNSTDCLMLGPAGVRKAMALKGMALPVRPLPAHSPDPELTKVDVSIAKINLEANEPAPLYRSFEDATKGENPVSFIDAGKNRYVSFVGIDYYKDKAYVLLKSGEWMRAAPTVWSKFQGLVFQSNPQNSFGWIIGDTRARTAPGYDHSELGPTLPRYTLLQIYDMQTANKTDWYMIAPGQWVERRFIRQVRVDPQRPEGVPAEVNRWVDVNLYDQTLTVYEDGKLVFATLVATGGEPFFTRPGTFQIYKKKPLETMRGAFEADRSDFYYFEDVPYTMYFDKARALHGAYWRAFFGYQGTHGCVNLSIGDSHWLYDWANEGDYVHVWDPSGETPTDPAFYGDGGA
ncbi:MAG: L,D-transpeptidase [Anaerolineaceae bacterium]|nr:L,D-transpeptidase [Anaerolineaceae bacterium]